MTAEQGFSAELRARYAVQWRRAHEEHPFVTGIGDGSLSMPRFQYFMRQDYLFLIDYSRVLAMACAKSPDLESMGRWGRLLDETLNSEMELHRSFCADFGITLDELEATRASRATAGYTQHLLTAAHIGTAAEIAAALLPCQWGYDEVGRQLAATLTAEEGSLHARWVAGYNDPAYQEHTAWLRAFTDRMGESAGPAERERMAGLFELSIRHEYLFWEAAWRLEEWPL